MIRRIFLRKCKNNVHMYIRINRIDINLNIIMRNINNNNNNPHYNNNNKNKNNPHYNSNNLHYNNNGWIGIFPLHIIKTPILNNNNININKDISVHINNFHY